MPDPQVDAPSVRDQGTRPDRTLVIKSGAGLEDPERCVQAFTVAATAVAMGVTVSLWLMGDAVQVAVPGAADALDLPASASLSDLLSTVLADGALTVCTQCAARRGLGPEDFIAGVRIAGAASYVEEVLAPQAQALIY